MTSLINFMRQYVEINLFEKAIIASKIKTRRVKRGEVLHHIGDVFQALYFIDRGLIRAYHIDSEGKDITWNIYFNDQDAQMVNLYVTDYDSLLHQKPSPLEFEVLEDSILFVLSYEDMQNFYAHGAKWQLYGRLMAEEAYSFVHNKYMGFLTQSAEERYRNFIKQTPYLAQKIPQYHIASLLGITPQHLSRLRAKIKSHEHLRMTKGE